MVHTEQVDQAHTALHTVVVRQLQARAHLFKRPCLEARQCVSEVSLWESMLGEGTCGSVAGQHAQHA